MACRGDNEYMYVREILLSVIQMKTKSGTLRTHKLDIVKQPHLVVGIRAFPFNLELVQRNVVLVHGKNSNMQRG